MSGELAHMVERPLSMREVLGSLPGFSNETFLLIFSFSRAISEIVFSFLHFGRFCCCFPHCFSSFGENPTVESRVHCRYLFFKKHSIAALLGIKRI